MNTKRMIGVSVSRDITLRVFVINLSFRGFSSQHAEEITDSSRMAFRRRDYDACFPGKFYGDVAAGAADYGQRSEEKIWTLNHFHGLMLSLLSSALPTLYQLCYHRCKY